MFNIVPTLRCNLRCRLCNVLCPYFREPYHPTMEHLFEQADRYFSVIPRTARFVVSGGEPLVRSDLHEWVYFLAKFAPQIERLDLNTNGTLIPDDRLLQSLSEYPGKIRVLVDDYGSDKSVKAWEAYEAFKGVYGAEVELRDYCTKDAHFGGWVDFGIYDLYKLQRKTDEQAVKTNATCSTPKMGYAAMMLNGIMYHCPRQIYLIAHKVIPALPGEAIDFFDDSLGDAELRQRVAAFYKSGAHLTCYYCEGLQEEAPVRHPAAEQMTAAEQHRIWEAHDGWRKRNHD
ncbi:MAG: radical SAM protein [Oscillospiraceae bacterium]|nr:radical SAM protein [Oscillospiraceae bacterium]